MPSAKASAKAEKRREQLIIRRKVVSGKLAKTAGGLDSSKLVRDGHKVKSIALSRLAKQRFRSQGKFSGKPSALATWKKAMDMYIDNDPKLSEKRARGELILAPSKTDEPAKHRIVRAIYDRLMSGKEVRLRKRSSKGSRKSSGKGSRKRSGKDSASSSKRHKRHKSHKTHKRRSHK